MMCPKCKGYNVTAQVITETKMVTEHHGFLWWLCIGWWWVPVKWVFLTVPALIIKIFAPKKRQLHQRQVTMWVCHDCGHNWKA